MVTATQVRLHLEARWGGQGVSSAWAQSALQPLAEVVSHMMGVSGNCLSQAVWGCSRRRCGVRSGHHETWRIPSTQKVDSGNLISTWGRGLGGSAVRLPGVPVAGL